MKSRASVIMNEVEAHHFICHIKYAVSAIFNNPTS